MAPFGIKIRRRVVCYVTTGVSQEAAVSSAEQKRPWTFAGLHEDTRQRTRDLTHFQIYKKNYLWSKNRVSPEALNDTTALSYVSTLFCCKISGL